MYSTEEIEMRDVQIGAMINGDYSGSMRCVGSVLA
jgi:hypothetical protein